ncbi:MAG: ATP-binding cassette domain-containing protein [Candidatus Pacebacteria bacterium]|nr:ATP-binding cassette domain-containing protein [Candidatus Paceibacterota bacterium]
MNQTPAIELRDVSVIYNHGTPDEVVALRGASLIVEKGETLIITGSNGSGKSTLLRAIAGTAPVTSGKIFIGGTDVTKWQTHRRAKLLGFIYQDPMLGTCPNMTVHENFRLVTGGRWCSLLPERLQVDMEQARLVESSGLPLNRKASTLINSLSGGQRQGAALVLALSSNRSILLMDEFTASLDVAVRASYIEIIAKQSIQQELTILGVMHDLDGISILNCHIIRLAAGIVHN